MQLRGSPDSAAGLPVHSKTEHSLCGGSLAGGRVCGSPTPRADLPPPFASGYRRVAPFFTKQYTNRSRHSGTAIVPTRSEEHTSELQSQSNLVCRLLLEKKNNKRQ